MMSRAELDIEKVKAGGLARSRNCPAVKRMEGLRQGIMRNYEKKLIGMEEFLKSIGAISLKTMRRKKKTKWDTAPPGLPASTDVVAPDNRCYDSDDSLRYNTLLKRFYCVIGLPSIVKF